MGSATRAQPCHCALSLSVTSIHFLYLHSVVLLFVLWFSDFCLFFRQNGAINLLSLLSTKTSNNLCWLLSSPSTIPAIEKYAPTNKILYSIRVPVLNDIECTLNWFRCVKRLNRAMSWNACDILMALFPVLRVFWLNNIASAVENTSWKPLEMRFPRL